MKESILEVKNLHFAYDEHHTVLDGISLSVFAGERIAILGSNGAGKSTFFLNLNGVLTPAEGEISYRGTKITRKTLKKLRQHIGIVFQDADNQIIASSVLAEVSFGPMNLKLPRSEVEERVNTALNYMNISQFKDRPPHYLSGGEKKRVSIADIIAMKSEIIIFDVILVGGSSRIPAVQELVEKFFGKTPSKGVNPDEVVAVGAAVQGAVLTDEIKGVVLLDVTPLSMGIETLGGVMTKLIDANTTIPARKSETFSTAADNQTEVTIHVLQGERPMAAQNKSIGQFNLTGIAPARRGVPQIEVTFDIDANGILKVSAKDKATGKEQAIRIEASSGLSKEEIEKMKAEAEANAEADKKEREKIDKLNQADSMIFSTENQLKELGDKLPADKKAPIEAALQKLKDAHKAQDLAAIDTAMAELNTAFQAASAEMYAQSGAQGGAQAGPGAGQQANQGSTSNNKEDIQDADFEEVK